MYVCNLACVNLGMSLPGIFIITFIFWAMLVYEVQLLGVYAEQKCMPHEYQPV